MLPKPGDRIELLEMPNDPDPIPVGSKGTVVDTYIISEGTQVDVDWDNGRSLMLIVPPDRFRIV